MLLVNPLYVIVVMALVASSVDFRHQAEALSPSIRELVKRNPMDHKSMMHSHMSRKVFDRACAASKDTLEEIIACVTKNEYMMTTVKKEVALKCHRDAFGFDLDPTDAMKHKEMICKNRDKFEQMTGCILGKTAEAMDPKQLEKLTETMVDVGLCIINALDG